MRLVAYLCAAVLATTAAQAASSCKATNDNKDATCSVDCETGQTAECSNGTGSSPPTCKCSDKSSSSSLQRWMNASSPRRPWIRIADVAAPPSNPDISYIDIPVEVAKRIRTRTDWVVRNFPTDTKDKWFKVEAVAHPDITVMSADLGTSSLGPPRVSFREVTRVKNCSPDPQTITVRYTQESSGSVDISLTRGFDSSVQTTTGFNAKILEALGVNAQIVQTEKISLSAAQKNSWTKRTGNDISIPVTVRSNTNFVGYVSRTSRDMISAFAATAVIDADVTYEFYDSRGDTMTARQKYTRRLTYFLPRQEDRIFTIIGRLTSATSTETNFQFLSGPLDAADHVTCPVPDVVSIQPNPEPRAQMPAIAN